MTAQRDYRLGNSLLRFNPEFLTNIFFYYRLELFNLVNNVPKVTEKVAHLGL